MGAKPPFGTFGSFHGLSGLRRIQPRRGATEIAVDETYGNDTHTGGYDPERVEQK